MAALQKKTNPAQIAISNASPTIQNVMGTEPGRGQEGQTGTRAGRGMGLGQFPGKHLRCWHWGNVQLVRLHSALLPCYLKELPAERERNAGCPMSASLTTPALPKVLQFAFLCFGTVVFWEVSFLDRRKKIAQFSFACFGVNVALQWRQLFIKFPLIIKCFPIND